MHCCISLECAGLGQLGALKYPFPAARHVSLAPPLPPPTIIVFLAKLGFFCYPRHASLDTFDSILDPLAPVAGFHFRYIRVTLLLAIRGSIISI